MSGTGQEADLEDSDNNSLRGGGVGAWSCQGTGERPPAGSSLARMLGPLVERSQSGDRDSRNQLFEQSAPLVRSWTRHLVGEERAPDLCQEVLLRAHRKLNSLKAPDAFLGWMRVMTQRMACNLLRKERPERRWWTLMPRESSREFWELIPGREAEPGAQIDLAEEREIRLQAVWAGIHSLETGLRRVAELYYRDGRSVSQICQLMGKRNKRVPPGTVKTMLARIRHSVRNQVEGRKEFPKPDLYPLKA